MGKLKASQQTVLGALWYQLIKVLDKTYTPELNHILCGRRAPSRET